MERVDLDVLLGRTLIGYTCGHRRLEFITKSSRFLLKHRQECCEDVRIEDVCGDLDDLVGNPIVQAEEVSSEGVGFPVTDFPSQTWTFYKFATNKGRVTVRFLGQSNGHYSESVDFFRC